MKFSTLIAYNSKPNFVQQGPFYNIWSHITYIYIKIKLNSKVILLIWKREHILHTEEHMYNTCIPDAGLQSVSLNPTISRNNQNCIIKAWQMLTYKWAVQVHIQSLTKFIITFDGHNQKIKQQMSVQWWVAFIILVISSQVHTGVHITQLLHTHTHTHTQCVCVCVLCKSVQYLCPVVDPENDKEVPEIWKHKSRGSRAVPKTLKTIFNLTWLSCQVFVCLM